MTTHSFFVEVSASIYMSDEDFAFVKECAKYHYDATVKSLVERGGFLYGLANRRDFSDGEDKILPLSGREIQILIKALEMEVPGQRQGAVISKRLTDILSELYATAESINSKFKKANV